MGVTLGPAVDGMYVGVALIDVIVSKKYETKVLTNVGKYLLLPGRNTGRVCGYVGGNGYNFPYSISDTFGDI